MAAVLAIADISQEFHEKDMAIKESPSDRDSGHWSEDLRHYTMPFNGLTDEEMAVECAATNNKKASVLGEAPCEIKIHFCNPELRSQASLDIEEPDNHSETDDTNSEIDTASFHSGPVISSPQLIGKECIVCFDPEVTIQQEQWLEWEWDPQIIYISSHKKLPCCHRLVCKTCLETIIKSNIDEGRISISCPHPECGKPFQRDYILEHCNGETKTKFNRFMVDIENDGTKKTCPNCCEITEHSLPKVRRLKEKDIKISCANCQHEWCYRCHAPWHKGVSCRDFQKGGKQFLKWTRGRNSSGIANCQKCPTCLVYIQRSTGCNHMTCNRCDTEFCYYCGNRFLELGIIDHDSTLNVWGCPNNYHPNDPVIRRLVRGGYLGAKISYLTGVPLVFVGACALVVVGAAIVLPIYGSVKLYHLIKFKQSNNRRKRRVK